MTKRTKKIILAILVSLFITNVNASFADEIKNSSDQNLGSNTDIKTEPTNEIEVANKKPPQLVAPIVEMPTPTPTQTNKKAVTPKIDLRAIIFDPNADFSAQAKDENREMTKTEEAEYNIHEALHGEISSLSKMSKKGMFEKYLTIYPKEGPLYSLNEYTGYRGYMTNAWNGPDYKNTLYTVDTLSTTFEGTFKDRKTSFRSMFFFQPDKAGHDFFNDFLGDQYFQYAWSKTDQVLFGYKRITNGLEGSSGPWVLPLMTRSQIAKTYNNVRSLGAKAQGSHKLYNYSLEFGSAGRYFQDWFPGVEYAASFDIKPLALTDGRYGNLTIGGAVNGGNAEGRYTVGSTYLDYEYKRWNFTFEYGSADGSNGSTGYTSNQSEGFNGTIAYRLTPKWQILARYDQFDPNKNKANDIRREYTVGLNYFIKDQFLRLIVNYTFYSIESGVYGSQILIGTQVVI